MSIRRSFSSICTSSLTSSKKGTASKTEIGWGHQIRSYVLQPYQLVKDLRTDVEIGNVQAVLDGGIDPFVEAYLRWRRRRA